MRVITGEAKGRRLKAVKGMATRPTTDRVKEALFSILGETVLDAVVLDLYAGTGSLGIEALSRGAKCATFIDASPESIRVIHANLQATGFSNRARVYRNDTLRALSILAQRGEHFSLVFLDPPYHAGLVTATLEVIGRSDLLAQGGLVVAEHSRREPLPPRVGDLHVIRQQRYGDTMLSLFTYDKEEHSDESCDLPR